MHVGRRWDQVWSEAQSVTWDYSVEDTFHIVSMVWTPSSIDMYMDDVATPYFHADLEPNDDADYNRQLVFGKPNFIIANVAVGGNFPGIYSVNQITALNDGPRSMYIDWIRIYQRGDANESFVCSTSSDPIEAERMENNLSPTLPSREGEKVLRNGQLLIRRGDHIYTITGQIVE
jgi:beta-glucanase (GH16 family)